MSTDSRASLLALVRPQIDATLGQAQEAMAKHVSQVAGNSALVPCVPHLHQVYGALRMVQFEGATRYAAELETALRNSMRSAAADKTEIESINKYFFKPNPSQIDFQRIRRKVIKMGGRNFSADFNLIAIRTDKYHKKIKKINFNFDCIDENVKKPNRAMLASAKNDKK